MQQYLISFLLLLSFQAYSAENSRISVTGNCIRTVIPDRASVQVSTEVLEKTVGEASHKATEFYNKMRDAFKKLNLKDLEMETTQYNLFEHVEWQNNKSVSKDFKAIIGLQVSTSETSRIGEVISQGTKIGSARVSGLSNYVSLEKMDQEREACLEVAVKNAKLKAEKIAQAAGVGLGKLENLNEEMSFQPLGGMQVMHMKSEAFGGAADSIPSANIEAGAKKISVSVSAGFAVK